MTTVANLRPDAALEQAGDAFAVDTVIDVEATDNSGLIPATAELLINLWRKRQTRERHDYTRLKSSLVRKKVTHVEDSPPPTVEE